MKNTEKNQIKPAFIFVVRRASLHSLIKELGATPPCVKKLCRSLEQLYVFITFDQIWNRNYSETSLSIKSEHVVMTVVS